MSDLFEKGKLCLGWFHVKRCGNIQSEKADNGLCEICEENRRKHITEQLNQLKNNWGNNE